MNFIKFWIIFSWRRCFSHCFIVPLFPRKIWYLWYAFYHPGSETNKTSGADFHFLAFGSERTSKKKYAVKVIFDLQRFFLFFANARSGKIFFCTGFEAKWLNAGCSDWLIVPTLFLKSGFSYHHNSQCWINLWTSRKHFCFSRRASTVIMFLSQHKRRS